MERAVPKNRIDRRFAELAAAHQRGLVVYITAGDPSLPATVALAQAIEEAGADVLELGVPFSDPLADGPVNQAAAQRALEAGTTVAGILEAVAAFRSRGGRIPVVLFSYLNPLLRFGIDRLMPEAAKAGVDGLLLLDMPPEEGAETIAAAGRHGLHVIYLLAPTSSDERVRRVAARARGFLYYVSREGVTGMQQEVSRSLADDLSRIRRHTSVPVAVGFGISNPEQAREAARVADAVVVGSAVVDRIARLGSSDRLVPEIAAFVRSLSAAVKDVAPA